MSFVADLHLHSKYSRAVSQNMILPEMARWASLKGLDVISTSDFTHPLWFRELKSQLEEASDGLYRLKSDNSQTLFLLSTEISSIYKQGEKLRRIHNLVFVPNLETVEKINKEFTKRAFNLLADGRPIIGLSSKDLLELLLSIDKNILLIPCHVWTPHFGLYGSASGFDSIEECFGNLRDYVYAVETGLSSDPEMNWQIEELRTRSILSFSDAHSGAKMGREATVFELQEPSYENIRKSITRLSVFSGQLSGTSSSVARSTDKLKTEQQKTENRKPKTDNRIQYTIEFYPEEGKYHFSGHRNCKVVRGPEETRKDGNICPVCKRRLTEGVLYRLQQLSNKNLLGKVEAKISQSGIKWYTDTMKNHPPFIKLVPLNEIISEAFSSTVSSQKVKDTFDNLCKNLGSEIEVLLKTPLSQIEKIGGAKLSQGLDKVRKGNIVIDPGYDGEYGKVKIWNGNDTITQSVEEKQESQLGLQF
ncbi:MAG: hypothetical protein A3F30_01725 [Candidatus Levybacteria bacterium RIFCSPHIGHO2_12_FULL_37_12]|nr:MAG: hypothetical protein A3F30_01725 [Candidatus Levybacteria bacterium RIFCSPHIGHO2_12_FULL_37_12]OGH32995.1 MAG: hypothetical protein A2953_01085 [Candidatus Levybacteria bacterium RIFCSPLOWO2_01_FULL_36_54]